MVYINVNIDNVKGIVRYLNVSNNVFILFNFVILVLLIRLIKVGLLLSVIKLSIKKYIVVDIVWYWVGVSDCIIVK